MVLLKTMAFFDFLCAPAQSPRNSDESSATFECDYDKNPSSLYQAMESRAWVPTLEFFETGKWSSSPSLFSSGEDPLPPERQARTWVTRFETDGSVRWSQLPLHAALIFGAPFKIVSKLVDLYPQGVRCTDDQHMLPLHLSMKFGADDSIVRLLLDAFPDAVFTKDIRGRLPTQIDGPKKDRTKIMDDIVVITTKTLQKKHLLNLQDELAELKDDLVLQNKLNVEIESQKKDLDIKYQRLQTEVIILRKEIAELQKKLESGSILRKSDQNREPRIENVPAPVNYKKENRLKNLVFGRKKETNGPVSSIQSDEDSYRSQARGFRSPPSTPSSAHNDRMQKKRESRLEVNHKERHLENDGASVASESDSINSTVSKGNTDFVQSKKLSRRGFFKGLGAKE